MKSLSKKALISKYLFNFWGWNTKRKIVVIESDDWGSIRMPNKQIFEEFCEYGFDLNATKYNKYDSIESNNDIEELFEVLTKFKDKNNNYPVITANYIVANPDFKKIKDSNFKEYHYEEFDVTLNRNEKSNKVIKLIDQGNKLGIFHPQFHGREHLNIKRWLYDLNNKEVLKYTFSKETTYSGVQDYNYMAAFDYNNADDLNMLNEILVDGLEIFKKKFGYSSKSIIAPCYVWNSAIEKTLADNGVKYIQGGNFQFIPTNIFEKYRKRFNYIGKQNQLNQIFLTRNNSFEPSLIEKLNWIGYTLDSMEICFKLNKPCIISAHRINFIGSIFENNRIKNLELFAELLKQISKKYPDVEFMTSDQLGDLIINEKN